MARIVQALNQNWLFQLGGPELNTPSVDTSEFECVHLPHSVALTPAISSGCVNYQGICTYYKTLHVTPEMQDQEILVEFDGAMGVTELYINGQLIKTHYCGYIPLVADITSYLVIGEHNTIALKLDNSDNEDVPPGKAQHALDFTYDGGLYREARLLIRDKLHVTHALLAEEVAGGGIFVSYSEVSEKSALVHIKTHVENNKAHDQVFTLVQTLRNDQKEIVQKQVIQYELKSGAAEHLEMTLAVENPQLWNPETPYLYELVTSIVGEDKCYDEVKTTLGIRTFEFTCDQGIVLNGVARRLSGANYHHTHVYIGNAMPESLLRRDVLKLREAGFKNIRSHYPLTPAFVDACNEYGLTLVVSAPGWQWFKEGIFSERAKDNVRKMVRWQRNNPCIIIWEPILNESFMSDNFKKEVHEIIHEEYPYDDCYTASDSGATDILYKDFDPGMLDPEKEGYEITHQMKKPIWVREYNDRPDDWDNQSCAWRVPRGWGEAGMLRAVERALGLDVQCQKQNYIDVVNDETICGYGIWPGIEHNRGYQVTPCWGGVLDLYRVPKFTYHFFRSQQDVEEIGVTLFIANYWSEISSNDVVVYSNAERVRLYHNEELVEEIGPDAIQVAHPPFTFKNVRNRYKERERSVIKAEALVGGEVVATQIRKSPGVQRALQLEADFMDMPLQANGADIVMVYCKVVDDEGNVVPMTADKYPILFTIEGEGEIVGDASIGANPICPEAGIAAVLVRATTQPGQIKMKAELLWKQHSLNAVRGDEIVFSSVEA